MKSYIPENWNRVRAFHLILLMLLGGNVMAYDLHIEDLKIGESDWVAYVNSSSELSLIHEVSTTNPVTGEIISMPMRNTGISKTGQMIHWSMKNGKIVLSSKYVNSDSVELMKRITKELGGVVIGDDGETY